MKNSKKNLSDKRSAVKDPDQWTTGDEPITGAQASYINTLSSEAGEKADTDLT